MSVDMAGDIALFLANNPIHDANIMGGEFWLNPDWEEILPLLVDQVDYARIVTNGDWSTRPKIRKAILSFLEDRDNCYFAITEDQWHTNKNTKRAANFCEKNDIPYILGGDDSADSVVPVGKAAFSGGLYSMMTTYCSKPSRRYKFLIDHEGTIYKCGFGIWDYANIEDYKDGDFSQRFKEFNQVFRKQPIFNCSRCKDTYDLARRKECSR